MKNHQIRGCARVYLLAWPRFGYLPTVLGDWHNLDITWCCFKKMRIQHTITQIYTIYHNIILHSRTYIYNMFVYFCWFIDQHHFSVHPIRRFEQSWLIQIPILLENDLQLTNLPKPEKHPNEQPPQKKTKHIPNQIPPTSPEPMINWWLGLVVWIAGGILRWWKLCENPRIPNPQIAKLWKHQPPRSIA